MGGGDNATDLGNSNKNPSSVAQGEMVNERTQQAERAQREKNAKKDKKAEDSRHRDAATAASLAQTRDMETPRAAGTRSSVQKTCMDGLMPTGADGQAAKGQGVFTNQGSREQRPKKAQISPAGPQTGRLGRSQSPAGETNGGTACVGKAADELARVFGQSANLQPAGSDSEIWSPGTFLRQETFGRSRRRRPAQTGWVRRLAKKHAAASSG
jgi:hypothetical protein